VLARHLHIQLRKVKTGRYKHAEHALFRGSEGVLPQEKSCIFGLLRLNLVALLSENDITLLI